MCYTKTMKTLLIILAALVALAVPTAALADGEGTFATPQGTLGVSVQGTTTHDAFDVDTPTPVLGDPRLVPQDISDRTDWQNHWINVESCVRVIFDNGADTGWHCVQQTMGNPTNSNTQSFTQRQVRNTIDTMVGVGYECTFWWNCGPDDINPITGQRYHVFQPVNLDQYWGTISGLIETEVCTDLDLTPVFGQQSATPLGCSGTVASTSAGFMAMSAKTSSNALSVSSCEGFSSGTCAPSAFSFHNSPNACRVPYGLRGKTVRRAAALLRANGCRVGRLSYAHSKLRLGHVIKPRIHAGRKLALGTRIPLVVDR